MNWNKSSLLRISLFLFLSAASVAIYAQRISSVMAVQHGEDIMITYDLVDASLNQEFEIRVYCSTDGGISWGNPLSQVEGDANKTVAAGTGKNIIWHVLREVNELKGSNIQFEVRAKAVASSGVEITGNVLIDQRDKKSYSIVKIKDTYWMAENLNFSTTQSHCYLNDLNKCNKYGRLYTWDEAKKSCPEGWTLPEEKDWNELEIFLGLPSNLANVMRWRGTIHGEKMKKGESSGFDALYGGYRSERGSFSRVGEYAYFWSGSEFNAATAYCRLMLYTQKGVYLSKYNKTQAMSVRCIKK